MLKMEQVRKEYGSFTLNCSLQVRPGQVTGLIGQNGAGKTTAFKAALGLISIDGGSIRILGKDIRNCTGREKQELGIVLSDSGFNGQLSIRDFVPVLSQLYDKFDRAFFLQQVERFELPQNQKIKEFSTGMKAKLKLLSALCHGSKLLILDEPTAGLDVVARDELLELLREYMEMDDEHAILISSHISNDLEHLCDDLYMIHEGTVILHEETDVLLSDYAVIKASAKQYEQLDKSCILRCCRENYGYKCLTKQKQYFMENYPGLVLEKGTIDEVIMMMIRGAAL